MASRGRSPARSRSRSRSPSPSRSANAKTRRIEQKGEPTEVVTVINGQSVTTLVYPGGGTLGTPATGRRGSNAGQTLGQGVTTVRTLGYGNGGQQGRRTSFSGVQAKSNGHGSAYKGQVQGTFQNGHGSAYNGAATQPFQNGGYGAKTQPFQNTGFGFGSGAATQPFQNTGFGFGTFPTSGNGGSFQNGYNGYNRKY